MFCKVGAFFCATASILACLSCAQGEASRTVLVDQLDDIREAFGLKPSVPEAFAMENPPKLVFFLSTLPESLSTKNEFDFANVVSFDSLCAGDDTLEESLFLEKLREINNEKSCRPTLAIVTNQQANFLLSPEYSIVVDDRRISVRERGVKLVSYHEMSIEERILQEENETDDGGVNNTTLFTEKDQIEFLLVVWTIIVLILSVFIIMCCMEWDSPSSIGMVLTPADSSTGGENQDGN